MKNRRASRMIAIFRNITCLAIWLTCGRGAQADEQKTIEAKELITTDNWTEMVGFKPDLSLIDVQKVKTIDKTNVDQFSALLPHGLKIWITKYNFNMKLTEYKRLYPSKGYIDFTNKYRGTAQILDTGDGYRTRGIKGYVAGLPFPKPQTGLEVAWDYRYSYIGDDADQYYTVYWVSADMGIEHKEDWRWVTLSRAVARTDIDPKPAIPSFEEKGFHSASLTYALSPYDKKGFGALYFDPIEPQDTQGHVYIPAMRRILRNTFGTRGDTWNATDLLIEDVRGYLGYPEWMNWKLIQQTTMLMCARAGVKRGKENRPIDIFEFENWPYWNPRVFFEPRAVYVVEATPKIPDYPYKRMIFIVDAETYQIVYKETYDKKGELWKTLLQGYNEPVKLGSMPPEFGIVVAIDMQSEHATLFNATKVAINVDLPLSMFTLSSLRKRSK